MITVVIVDKETTVTTTASEFCPGRVRLARTFNGWTQAELGERTGVTHQYVGYLETGYKTPTALNVEAIAAATGFNVRFFHLPLVDEFRDEECHFRRRTTTPVSVRTRVLAHGTLFGALVSYIDTVLSLPAHDIPSNAESSSAESIERATEAVRDRWGLGRDVPIKNLTRAVERAGVVVTRFEGCSAKVDAFSRSGKRHIIILNTEKQSTSRSRFDLAHECGHLVLHGGRTTGDVDTEKEADRFASALLLPRSGFAREFPRGYRLDWTALFQLKKRWGVSVSAQIRRAYDLRMIDAAQYQRAYKYIAARGWLKGEPEEPELEQPELVQLSLAALATHYSVGPRDVCDRLGWQERVFERVACMAVPTDPPPRESNVIRLQHAANRRNSKPG